MQTKIPFYLRSVLAGSALCTALLGTSSVAWASATVSSATSAAETVEAPVQLDPLTVIGHPSGADERPGAVWVVPMEAGVETATHVRDLFIAVPGLHLNQPGGPGGRSSLWIRGAEDNYAIVYLDGIPLNDPTNSTGGAVDFSLLDPAIIQSAAVVRGPSSVRYGAEALAGVVHLGTDPAGARTRRLEAEAGGNDLRRGALLFQEPLSEQASFAFSAAGTDAGSLDFGSRERRRAYRSAVTWHGPVNVKVAAWHLVNDSDTFPDDSGGKRLAEIRTLETRRHRATAASLQLDTEIARRRWSLAIDTAQFDANTVSPGVAPGQRDPFGLPASTDDTRLRRLRVKAMVEHALRGWRYSGGIDFERESGRDDGTLEFAPGIVVPTPFSIDRNHGGIFAETDGPLTSGRHAITLALGGRIDRYGGGLTRGTVRTGLLGVIDDATDWRLNAGNAFKPPSFYALANPLVGNPDLKPERGVTVDAGIRRRIDEGRGLLDFTVFASRYKDATDFDPGPPPRIVNRNQIDCQGAEAALEWHLSAAWRVGGSLTYVDARRDPGNVRMRARPQWRGGAFVHWTPQTTLTVTGSLLAIGRVPDSSIPTGDVMLPGWARCDLAVAWRVHEQWTVTAAIDNLLDAHYEEAVGFPSPGRTVRGGLRVEF